MTDEEIIDWLLTGDVSIQYQVNRDLLGIERKDLQRRIATEGWGEKFLTCRQANGHWGIAYYRPKWTSTHYTLLDLKNLGIAPGCKPILQTVDTIITNEKGVDGGILVGMKASDVCINGMALNFLSYFRTKEKDLQSIVDFLLSQRMPDGGFNCYSNRKGAVHSSLHSTLSVLEGITEYEKNNYTYRADELQKSAAASREFILQHHMYKSDRTGEIIDKKMLIMHYPYRWRYDILRALEYFCFAGIPYDKRMQDAIDVLLSKQDKNGIWSIPANLPGHVHFQMEQAGKPSRWNTLRALRVLKHYTS